MRTPVRGLLAARIAPWAGGSLLLALAVVAIYFFTGAAASQPSKAPQAGADDITYGPKAWLYLDDVSVLTCTQLPPTGSPPTPHAWLPLVLARP